MKAEIPRVSRWLMKWFTWYGERYVARNFHSVCLSREPVTPVIAEHTPLIVYLNHPSWWDPMICLILAAKFFSERIHYAPIDAAMLDRYRFFRKLGCFGIEPNTRRGAAHFLRTGMGVLTQPRTALWITAQGRFTDPRQRPVQLQPGVGHLARRLQRGTVLPLALEYPFWEQRFPEALARWGEPISIENEPRRTASEWTGFLAQRLESAQNALSRDARERRITAFEMLGRGVAGVGGVYDAWRASRARLSGESFHSEHR